MPLINWEMAVLQKKMWRNGPKRCRNTKYRSTFEVVVEFISRKGLSLEILGCAVAGHGRQRVEAMYLVETRVLFLVPIAKNREAVQVEHKVEDWTIGNRKHYGDEEMGGLDLQTSIYHWQGHYREYKSWHQM